MAKRYEFYHYNTDAFMLDSDSGDYVLYTDHVAEMKELVEYLNKLEDVLWRYRTTEDGEYNNYDVIECDTALCVVLDKYRHYLDKGE